MKWNQRFHSLSYINYKIEIKGHSIGSPLPPTWSKKMIISIQFVIFYWLYWQCLLLYQNQFNLNARVGRNPCTPDTYSRSNWKSAELNNSSIRLYPWLLGTGTLLVSLFSQSYNLRSIKTYNFVSILSIKLSLSLFVLEPERTFYDFQYLSIVIQTDKK